jgi:hypothetical protein
MAEFVCGKRSTSELLYTPIKICCTLSLQSTPAIVQKTNYCCTSVHLSRTLGFSALTYIMSHVQLFFP